MGITNSFNNPWDIRVRDDIGLLDESNTMTVELQKATINDAEVIHRMQLACFAELLEKYQDHDINPGAESLAAVECRLKEPGSDYYLIVLDFTIVGAVRVVQANHSTMCRISPVFVLPNFRGMGVAQTALLELEGMYRPKDGWALQTIFEETANCRLYEKLGYEQIGEKRLIKEGMHLVTYAKRIPAQ